MNYNKIFILMILIVINACMNNKTKNKETKAINNFRNNWNLTQINTKKIELDHETLPNSKSYQYIILDSVPYITFLNKVNKSIYYYNYDSCKLEYIWGLDKSIKEKYYFTGHYIHNKDSIFLLNYSLETLYLFNNNGLFKKELLLSRNKLKAEHAPAPVLGTFNPLKINKNYIICSGYIFGEYEDDNRRPIGIKYNLKDQEKSYFLKYPDNYDKYNYAGGKFRTVYFTYTDSQLIFSFPASPDIKYYDIPSRKTYKQNTYNKKVKPLNRSKDYNPTKKDLRKLFLLNYYYGPIIFDKYRKCYYRIKYFPKKKINHSDWKTWQRNYSVEIFDVNFQKQGEKQFKKKTFLNNSIFVSKEGLVIREINENDDIIIFNVYNFKK